MKKLLSKLLVVTLLISSMGTAQVFAADTPFIFDSETGTITDYLDVGHVEIPATIDGVPVTSIGMGAFYDKQLTSVTIPDSVTSIGGSAFLCNKLKNITIPDSVTDIGDYAFKDNQLNTIIILNSVTSIGKYAFASNQLTSVIIPDSVTSIGNYAFDGNDLTSITMERADTSIGDFLLTTNAYFRDDAYKAGGIGTYVGTQTGRWTKELTDTDKVSEAKTSIETAISNLTVSNETTAQAFLTHATNATLHDVNVAWDETNGFNKTDASTTAGSITGILNLTLNGASDTVNVSKTIALLAINIPAIQGVTAPVNGATPVMTITETAQYTGTVTWSPADTTFEASTIYTATITLTPKAGYTLAGVAENFFTVAGVTGNAINAANTGIITAVFPETALPVMTGTVVITGDAKFDATLTADISSITYTPTTESVVPTYQWNRGGTTIDGATASTYKLVADDIDAVITVTVTADGTNATGSVTSAGTVAVEKAAGPVAPDAPTEASKTTTSITLEANATHEFSKDVGNTWQDSPEFTGLTASTAYTFTARVKATTTHNNASVASPGTAIITEAPPAIGGTVAIDGDTKFGSTLTANSANLTNAGTSTYQWNRAGEAIDGATATTYTLAEADIGTVITVTATADGVAGTGSITSAETAQVFAADTAEGHFTFVGSKTNATITDYSNEGPKVVVIPSTIDGVPITSIGDFAFNNNQLTSVIIPDSVTSIGERAFSYNLLKSITIPDSVTSIDEMAFRDNLLKSITIPNSVTSIGRTAFYKNELTSVIIPDSVTSIEDNVFWDNQLTSVTIPNSLTSIGDSAFRDNELTSVTIPNNVTSIGDSAFVDNQLTSITMERADTAIGNYLLGNNNFKTAYLADRAGVYVGTQTGTWTKEHADTDKIAEAKTSIETAISNLTVSNETTAQTILTHATNATLHDVNVAWDETNGFNKTDASTSAGSITGTVNLTLNGASDTVTVSKTIALSEINIPAIQGVTVPVNGATPVMTITETAQYTGTVTWSPADTTFAASTIYTATIKLTPKEGYTLTGVAENFFTVAGVSGNATNNADEGIITAAFEQLPSLFTFDEGTKTITGYTGPGGDVVIPAVINEVDVEHIGESAFENKKVTSVTIPNSVTSIGDEAFWENQLTSVTIPNSVTSIGEDAFRDNQLTSVIIPDSVTSIGGDAFRSNSLASIMIPDSVSSIGSRAFHDNQLTSIKMSKADITIGASILYKNDNFRSSYLTGGIGTYTGTQTGTWTKEHADTDKIAEAKTSIETAISNLTVSNETTAQTILTHATNATLHDVNVAWDDTNGFNKTNATSTTAGAITGTVNLTLNGASGTVTVSKAIAQLPSSGGSSSSGRDDSTPIPQVQEKVFVIVNGEKKAAGTEAKSEEEGRSVVTVAVNSEAIDGKIEDVVKNNTEGSGNIIQVPVGDTKSQVAKVELTGDIVKKLEDNTFDVSIKRDTIEYIIPAEEFTISKVAENLGVSEKDLDDIKVEVKITNLDETVVAKYKEVAKANGAELVFPPVEFEIVAKTTKVDGTTEELEISKFSNYVERVMEIPVGVDQSKITTGIVFNPDGTYSHVPTEVFFKDGKWYAKLNSLTNSNYSVIWNTVTVESVENHWAKDAVNDMASRLVIFNPEKFEPNKAITRGDFAEYMVRALGLYKEETTQENKFIDVSSTGERTLAILVASEYGIVSGYTDGTFKPDELITREEAMTMYQRAMKMTKLTGMDSNRYQNYKDFEEVSHWATSYVKEVLAAHVFNGTSTTTTISPKLNITYAEAAQGIKNLLVESKLINN